MVRECLCVAIRNLWLCDVAMELELQEVDNDGMDLFN
jgi:hypothetical protein